MRNWCAGTQCLSAGVSAHELFISAAFEGHRVTPVKQFQAEDYEATVKATVILFWKVPRERSDEILLWWLSSLRLPCLFRYTDHKNHNIELLQKAVGSVRAKHLSETEAMRKKEAVCNDTVREFAKMTCNLEFNVADAKL